MGGSSARGAGLQITAPVLLQVKDLKVGLWRYSRPSGRGLQAASG